MFLDFVTLSTNFLEMNTDIDTAERDHFIYLLMKKRVSVKALSKRFELSEDRIRHIYIEQHEKLSKGDYDIPEINTMCQILGIDNTHRGSLQAILRNNGYTNQDETWVYTDIDVFEHIPHIGKTYLMVIWLAQHMRAE